MRYPQSATCTERSQSIRNPQSIVRWFMILIVVLVMAGPAPYWTRYNALAQEPESQHTDPNWQATYWKNMKLSKHDK